MIAEKRKFFFSFLSVQRGCVCYDSSVFGVSCLPAALLFSGE